MASAARMLTMRGGALRGLTGVPAQFLRTAAPAASAGAVDASGASHWKIERVLSVALVPLCLSPFVTGGGYATDMMLAVAVPVHNHMGMDVVLSDYVKPDSLMAATKALNWVVGAGTIGGLVYFNHNDVGICKGLAQLWAL
mmetsp:Transcript_36557/g.95696  ORF Transcript_36557/g.95696 Transcript_36557/m.95696 type:complete len:141 (+) Transcript_36557:44-466(+)|eukprot:CAMPEP_0182927950 /NCGR_PEP_ID=MMETSP0105_2-20130417/14792_1 /TAXON_ID=81532 ORGANISM="Acanthoeca-like sp., Strain 10tr" /NCGR_SAMPLE_ID=MMETSP0105_2 /ASSEMBLY_ACC=CAM_ASM_000205 /LENGTH=140 /DNA_ID=CAMNT_0025065933 /DNA_START=40 /DNA_END=462 /DNA_ORIENTATION=+